MSDNKTAVLVACIGTAGVVIAALVTGAVEYFKASPVQQDSSVNESSVSPLSSSALLNVVEQLQIDLPSKTRVIIILQDEEGEAGQDIKLHMQQVIQSDSRLIIVPDSLVGKLPDDKQQSASTVIGTEISKVVDLAFLVTPLGYLRVVDVESGRDVYSAMISDESST